MLFFLSFLLSVWSLFSYVENVRVAHFFSFLWCIVLFFYCNVFLHPVSCVPNAASGSGLSSSCVLCAQCCRWLWIVFILCLVCPMLPVALDCLRPVCCVPNAAGGSGLSSSCVLCAQCCRWLWIVHSLLPLRFSLTFIYLHVCCTWAKLTHALHYS
jgi:hypothetical protein